MVEMSPIPGAWEAERRRRFDAWRAAHPGLDSQVQTLKAETARLASERARERAGRWARTCAAAADKSAALSEGEQARVLDLQRQAEAHAGGGDGAGAVGLYEQVLRIDPANVDANHALGELLRQAGDLAGASQRFCMAAAFPKVGSDNGYFRSMMALQRLPAPPDPALAEPTVIFRVDGAPAEIWDAPAAPVMTVIPGGEFTMGSLETEANRGAGETPHRVAIAYPLAVSRADVTRGEFAAFVADTGHDAESAGDVYTFRDGRFGIDPQGSWRNPGFDQTEDEPVTCVNYYDGLAYADWLTRTTGHTYRLPSEAEWEHAVRGGTSTSYSWGEGLGLGNAHCDGCTAGEPLLKPTPGGAFPPNPFGLYDVCGNVWKWLADAWNPTYAGAPADGSAWMDGVTVLRGRRGGSWFNIAEGRPDDVRAPFRLRSAARFGSLPALRFSSFGLRVVRDL
jgi:formylglycine-generating enzyme required for sulfatase activity